MSDQEKEHAITIYKLLIKQDIKYDYLMDMIEGLEDDNKGDEYLYGPFEGDTGDNLQEAVDLTEYESVNLYVSFADTGVKDVDDFFIELSKVEKTNNQMLLRIKNQYLNDSIYIRDEEIDWKCLKCGDIIKGHEPPDECPSCGHSKSYFEPLDLTL